MMNDKRLCRKKNVCTFYYKIIVYKNMPQIIPTQKHIERKPKLCNSMSPLKKSGWAGECVYNIQFTEKKNNKKKHKNTVSNLVAFAMIALEMCSLCRVSNGCYFLL